MTGAPASQHGNNLARRHANALLDLLGITAAVNPASDHPALGWRRAGLQAVTGRDDGPALVAPVPLSCAADGALTAFQALAPHARLPPNGAVLLGERARLLGLRRRGSISANGSCRLIRVRDGYVALNLPRSEDWDLLPALFGAPAPDWEAVEKIAVTQSTECVVAQGRLLGLAIAVDREPDRTGPPFTVAYAAAPRQPGARAPWVIDLSSLWAGPLAGSLLQQAGARVIKIESRRRPDGARSGDQQFFDLLNAEKASVVLDFSDAADQAALHALISRADIVIESTRPRALQQLGIHAEALVAQGTTWVSITGHGRHGAAAGWVGFGDDAAIAGGLGAAMRRGWSARLFAGDAIADPLAGITAALAAWAVYRKGGGLIALSLSQVIAHAIGLGEAGGNLAAWQALAAADDAPFYPLRQSPSRARDFGADAECVLASLRDSEAPLPGRL